MEGIIPVGKGKHLFAKVPKNIPNEIREEIIKEQKRLKLQKRNYNYYVKNREKILEKNRIKAKEESKYNIICGVKKKRTPTYMDKIDLKVKHGKFIISFD